MKDAAFIEDVLQFVAENDLYDKFFWDTRLNFYIECNDLFIWGTSDLEPIECEEDLRLLNECLESAGEFDGPELYCCKKRNARPQNEFYTLLDKENWHLFDACGPERESGPGNPGVRPDNYPPIKEKPHIYYREGYIFPWYVSFYDANRNLKIRNGSDPEYAYNQYLSYLRMLHGVIS